MGRLRRLQWVVSVGDGRRWLTATLRYLCSAQIRPLLEVPARSLSAFEARPADGRVHSAWTGAGAGAVVCPLPLPQPIANCTGSVRCLLCPPVPAHSLRAEPTPGLELESLASSIIHPINNHSLRLLESAISRRSRCCRRHTSLTRFNRRFHHRPRPTNHHAPPIDGHRRHNPWTTSDVELNHHRLPIGDTRRRTGRPLIEG